MAEVTRGRGQTVSEGKTQTQIHQEGKATVGQEDRKCKREHEDDTYKIKQEISELTTQNHETPLLIKPSSAGYKKALISLKAKSNMTNRTRGHQYYTNLVKQWVSFVLYPIKPHFFIHSHVTFTQFEHKNRPNFGEMSKDWSGEAVGRFKQPQQCHYN